jgi:hypothetical protein
MKADSQMRRSISVGAFAAVVLLAMPHVALAAGISIGVISPVTGPVALDGESFRHGAELAMTEINAAGGVLSLQLGLIVEDGECKPNVSASAAEKLMVRDSVPVMVGAHCSPATAAIIPMARTPESAVGDGYFECAEFDGNAARMVLPFGADRSDNGECGSAVLCRKARL